jgi:putative hydrolase of the HAD superfamily
MGDRDVRAVLWDFGGVILTSPFEAFARYEAELGLPTGFIRGVNATNPDGNAWARLERSELDLAGFAAAFEVEARAIDTTGAAERLSGARVIELLAGEVRPQMVRALDACKGHGLAIACLTNNVADRGDGAASSGGDADRKARVAAVMARFDVVVESSKVGYRKPETRFYEIACELLSVAPDECVFLDDLGINLKPARALGMRTVKVGDPDVALAELAAILGRPVG